MFFWHQNRQLTMDYRKFCAQTPDLPIFFQPWYLDAACQGGTWGAAMVVEQGQVVGIWTYFLKRKAGFAYLTMPPLVKFMGPWLPTLPALTEQHRIYQALLQQIPPVASSKQDCHYQLTNWLPFYWEKFRQSTKYSYHLDLSDLEQVQAQLNRNMRRNIAKAKEQVTVVQRNDPAAFYAINQLSFRRQGLPVPYSWEQFNQLDVALGAHQARQMFFAEDNQGRIHAAAYLIWDRQCSYYHLAGDDPALRQSGASILLIWAAIQYTQQTLVLRHFDFLGSMLAPIEAIRRQFGARQVPYFFLQRYSSVPYQILDRLLAWGRGEWR